MNFTPLNRGRKQNKDTKAKNNKSDCLSTAHLGSHQSTLNTIREEKNATKSKEKSKKRMSKIYYKISPLLTWVHTTQHHHRKSQNTNKVWRKKVFLFGGSTFVIILVITILIIIMIKLSASLSA